MLLSHALHWQNVREKGGRGAKNKLHVGAGHPGSQSGRGLRSWGELLTVYFFLHMILIYFGIGIYACRV